MAGPDLAAQLPGEALPAADTPGADAVVLAVAVAAIQDQVE
jgi:hypothetical protein